MHIIGMTMPLSSAYCWSIITVFHDHPSDKHVNLGSTVTAPEKPHLHPTRQRTRDVAACASGHILPRVSFFFSGLTPMQLRLGLIRVESGQLGPYRAKPLKWPIQAKIQKKKKKRCKTHRLNLITNPTSAHFIQTPNFSSLSLRHSSLTLSVLFASLSLLSISSVAVRHSATQSLHSNFSSLSRILNLVIDIKLSILV